MPAEGPAYGLDLPPRVQVSRREVALNEACFRKYDVDRDGDHMYNMCILAYWLNWFKLHYCIHHLYGVCVKHDINNYMMYVKTQTTNTNKLELMLSTAWTETAIYVDNDVLRVCMHVCMHTAWIYHELLHDMLCCDMI